MKKKIVIFCKLFFAFVFLISIITYADNTYSEDYTSSHLYVTTDVNSYYYAAGATINKMKMTQDDNYFYISFDIDYACPSLTYDRNKVIGTSRRVGGYTEGTWDIYQGAEFGNLFVSECPNYGVYRYVRRNFSGGSYSGKTNYQGNLTIDGKYSAWDYDNGYNNSGNYTRTYTWNGNTYYIFPSLFSNDGSSCNAYYTNGNYLSYTTACDFGVNYWKFNAIGSMSISKSDVTHYKYLNLYSPFAVKSYSQYYSRVSTYDSGNSEYTGVGLYATPIDISEYLACDHEWELINISDKMNHKKHCKNCEWTTIETHELIYEYDGIENNMCECGYKDKLRYSIVINDDNIATLSYIVDSYGTIPEIPEPHRTGYKFDYFEKYELRPEGEVLVATCSTIELTTDNYSTTYKAHFSPIHYTFHYSNENNLGLIFEDTLADNLLEYDAITKLPPHLHKDGYIFEGWTYATTSEVIIYTDEAEVLNHTINDFEEFTLYPRYRVLSFIIKYKASGGRYINGLETYEKWYSYFDDSRLETPYPYSDQVFFRFFTTNIDDIGTPRFDEKESDYNVYKDMIEIKNLLGKNEYDFVILYAHFGSTGIGTSERTTDGIDREKEKKNQGMMYEESEKLLNESEMPKVPYFAKGYKTMTTDDKIYVYDLSQTIYEKFSDRISSTSYIVRYGNMETDIGTIMLSFISIVMGHPIESLLFLTLLFVVGFYAFLRKRGRKE